VLVIGISDNIFYREVVNIKKIKVFFSNKPTFRGFKMVLLVGMCRQLQLPIHAVWVMQNNENNSIAIRHVEKMDGYCDLPHYFV